MPAPQPSTHDESQQTLVGVVPIKLGPGAGVGQAVEIHEQVDLFPRPRFLRAKWFGCGASGRRSGPWGGSSPGCRGAASGSPDPTSPVRPCHTRRVEDRGRGWDLAFSVQARPRCAGRSRGWGPALLFASLTGIRSSGCSCAAPLRGSGP